MAKYQTNKKYATSSNALQAFVWYRLFRYTDEVHSMPAMNVHHPQFLDEVRHRSQYQYDVFLTEKR